jgi:DNA-directed RNA polymerase subunit RPC12/RpoP
MGMVRQMREQPPAGTEFACLRCGATWQSRKDGKPKACGRCKSAYWDRPKPAVAHSGSGATSVAGKV